MFIVIIVLIFCLALAYVWLYRRVAYHLPENFPSKSKMPMIDASKKTVVCFGDSNTHGNVSYDWVKELSKQMPDYQFINAGRNSDLTYTLLDRIEPIIACNPQFIIILIGTNDVNATMSSALEKRYQKIGRIDKNTQPNFEGFKHNYQKIIHELKANTKARIAVMSLPIMGENLNHSANLKADQYSDFIMQLSIKEELTYLPVRESQKNYLTENSSNSPHTFEETYKLLNVSVLANVLLGWSWDKVSKHHGFQLTPDNLHQNSISGGMIQKLVKEFLLMFR
jgi:lysophospholipase L1-like esterase